MTSKEKKQFIMIGVGLLIFAGVLTNSIMKVNKKKKAKAPQTPQAEVKSPEGIVKDAQAMAAVNASGNEDLPLSSMPTKAVLKKEALEDQRRVAEGEWAKDPFYHD